MNQPGTMREGFRELPIFSWFEDLYFITDEGKKLPRWGSVKQASQILWDCDRGEVYDLIDAGLIVAKKLRPHRPNSHWKVDLLSVWKHRQNEPKGTKVAGSSGQ